MGPAPSPSDFPVPPAATGVITIDLGRIARNWRALADFVGPAACGAVVKADAYGLGAARVIPALAAAGCRDFFVATPDEAVEARPLAPDATVFVLDGLIEGAEEALQAAGAIPVLASLEEVHAWADRARRRGGPLPAAIHIDSGLNRLGLSRPEVDALAGDADLLAALDLRLVMSHLASADDPTDPKNEAQRRAFDARRGLLPAAPASLAASDGLMLGPSFHYDLVRPGYALYGGQAFRGAATPVEPVLSVAARILQVRDVAPGETVGYSGTWTARRPSRIAIVAAGYADGFARALTASGDHDGGVARLGGNKVPVVGRVSMDLITLDVTDAGDAARRGALVELIGHDLTIEDMGARAGTIGYEVLTRLGRRFHRRYLEGTA